MLYPDSLLPVLSVRTTEVCVSVPEVAGRYDGVSELTLSQGPAVLPGSDPVLIKGKVQSDLLSDLFFTSSLCAPWNDSVESLKAECYETPVQRNNGRPFVLFDGSRI